MKSVSFPFCQFLNNYRCLDAKWCIILQNVGKLNFSSIIFYYHKFFLEGMGEHTFLGETCLHTPLHGDSIVFYSSQFEVDLHEVYPIYPPKHELMNLII